MIKYHLSRSMKILFVGINPSHGTYRRHIPFSNNKKFWYLLNEAGLLQEEHEDLKNDRTLKQIYEKKFNPVYHLGLINLIDRPADKIAELKAGEEKPGRKRLHQVIKRHAPHVVCFVGKATYEKFIGSRVKAYGWKPDIFASKVYLMHSPLHGLSSVRVRELKTVKRAAKID